MPTLRRSEREPMSSEHQAGGFRVYAEDEFLGADRGVFERLAASDEVPAEELDVPSVAPRATRSRRRGLAVLLAAAIGASLAVSARLHVSSTPAVRRAERRAGGTSLAAPEWEHRSEARRTRRTSRRWPRTDELQRAVRTVSAAERAPVDARRAPNPAAAVSSASARRVVHAQPGSTSEFGFER
jgi:hypothetical protein